MTKPGARTPTTTYGSPLSRIERPRLDCEPCCPNLLQDPTDAYLAFGVAFHVVLGAWRDRFNLQLSLHAFADIVAITLLMFASGGMRSGLGIMLLISLIGAALVAPSRLSLLYAAVASIAVLLEQTYWVLAADASEASYLQPALFAIGCFACAGVTSWLAQRVSASERLARQRGQELENQMRVNRLVIAEMQDGVLVLTAMGTSRSTTRRHRSCSTPRRSLGWSARGLPPSSERRGEPGASRASGRPRPTSTCAAGT